MRSIQGYLNQAERIKTWVASGKWASVAAMVVAAVCYATGHQDAIEKVIGLAALVAGALGKLAAELAKQKQGDPVPPNIGKTS